jgi:predicted NAD-dependent protein-ADP-ribosyltransferase YbiA (DUF1768 family)
MFTQRTASELAPFVRTTLIPHAVKDLCNLTQLRKQHPNVELSEATTLTGKLPVLNFKLPEGDDKSTFHIVVDIKNHSCAVVFGRVGCLSNHSKTKIRFGGDVLMASETAFVLARLSFTYRHTADPEDRAHICDIWQQILKADTPFGARVESLKLRKGIFDSDRWDSESMEHMFSVLLAKYSQDADAYAWFKALDDFMTNEHHISHFCFVETEHDIWGSGAAGPETVAALSSLDEITPASVAGALKGKNQLGEAYNLLYDAYMAAETRTFAGFKAFVADSLPPLFEAEAEASAEAEAGDEFDTEAIDDRPAKRACPLGRTLSGL